MAPWWLEYGWRHQRQKQRQTSGVPDADALVDVDVAVVAAANDVLLAECKDNSSLNLLPDEN